MQGRLENDKVRSLCAAVPPPHPTNGRKDMVFKVGQRWVSQTESHLGLGIVEELSNRRLRMAFPAAETERFYAVDTAPLSRACFKPGDQVELANGHRIQIEQAAEHNGLMFYTWKDESGDEQLLPETALSADIRLTTPSQRLLGGLVDRLSTYRLRIEVLRSRSRLGPSPARGLLGARIGLLPHQLYIASELSRRLVPRALLADEVGLGKTIEACLVIHAQILRGLARRVLVIVPEALQVQWLVELLRRFNLPFAIFDDDRFEATIEEGWQNPFESAQWVIISREMMEADSQVSAALIEADWDLVVVDEAQHLHPQSPGFAVLESLNQPDRGLLLLSATPEQLGEEGHFARLHLLDADRFPDLESFHRDLERYHSLADLVRELDSVDEALSPDQKARLAPWLGKDIEADISMRDALNLLIDRYGTGRCVYRNTRHNLEGFPERQLHRHPLRDSASGLQPALLPEQSDRIIGSPALCLGAQVLAPDEDLSKDPRTGWLVSLARDLRPARILVICNQPAMADSLARVLQQEGLKSASFHEGMAIVERDRAAAWFAETEGGAQLLVCSEIGSEGRNFQFAQHLVLFDLPLDADLLEQRIGRLDRIGQRATVEIHVPYLAGSPWERLLDWYEHGLKIFEGPFAGAAYLQEEFAATIEAWLRSAGGTELLEEVSKARDELAARLENGRDLLLEKHSLDDEIADQIIEEVIAIERSQALRELFESLCDHFGVHHEEHGPHSIILKPSDEMLTGHFPGLSADREDGITVTFNREQALRREDLQFLTWEHPMVDEAMDMMLSAEYGNACVVTLPLPAVPPATLLLEAWFSPQVTAAEELGLSHYLDLPPLRVLVNVSGKSLASLLSAEQLDSACLPLKRHTAVALVDKVNQPIEDLLRHANALAEAETDAMIARSQELLDERLGQELGRLESLDTGQEQAGQSLQIERERLQLRLSEGKKALESARFDLQAARLLVTTQET